VGDTRVLETIRSVNVVVLDKTGTVTLGDFTLLETIGDGSRLGALAAIEAQSEHPIAKALAAHAAGLTARDVTIHPGRGISGMVDGTRYHIGNAGLMPDGRLPLAEVPGATVVYFAWDDAVRGALAFGDRIRTGAAELCAELRRRSIGTVLLSGDSLASTERVARAIGADKWIGEATPERKIEIIRGFQTGGAKVAMIGDGVNDAPSLAAADLGIAVGSGTDIAMHAAPLVLMNQTLGSVIEVLDLAGRSFRIVRQNLFWAFVYNAAGITLAVTGVLNPILAAAAMMLSSLSVLANSRRLLRNAPRPGRA
jgi:P-type E1-E2 ATPase